MHGQPEKVNTARLKHDLAAFAQIGRKPDREGLYRMAFTAEEETARTWLIEAIRAAGLSLHVDGARNISARLGDGGGAAVATGSHIDSVPGGGHLDGALGVLCGLECLRRMQELDLDLQRPVELLAFTDEEARFGSLFGSKAICGQHDLADLRKTTDEYGHRLGDVLTQYNSSFEAVMKAERSSEDFAAFVELHIEQGPVLDLEGISIGVVSAITGLFRWRAVLKGAANHAGTTPMHLRRDALGGLIEFAAGIEHTLKAQGSEYARATIGKVETLPGAISVIPGEVHFLFDVRDTDEGRLERLRQAFENQIREIGRRRALSLHIETIADQKPVQCDPELAALIEAAAGNLGFTSRRLPSGAGHDTVSMASITKAGMIFVPSIEGISHSQLENSHWHDIENGANVLLNVLISLGQDG
jgi:N-carbamoyl-L-amino-acid hydrolase